MIKISVHIVEKYDGDIQLFLKKGKIEIELQKHSQRRK
jgi:hypothetical protein